MRVSHSGRATQQSRVCDLGVYRFLTPLALRSPLSVLNLPNGRDSGSTKKEVDSLNAFYLHLNLFMYFVFVLFSLFSFFLLYCHVVGILHARYFCHMERNYRKHDVARCFHSYLLRTVALQ